MLGQERDDREAGRLPHQVQVVEQERDPRCRSERVHESRQHHPLDSPVGSRQAPKDPWIDRGDACKGGRELHEQDDRVVVRLIEGHPRGWPAGRGGDVLGEEGGLAVAGGGADDDHREAGFGEAAREAVAPHEARAQGRRMELRLDDDRIGRIRRSAPRRGILQRCDAVAESSGRSQRGLFHPAS